LKTLVTGGAGFIGSHLVDRLLSEGHEVIVLDDFSSGKISNLKSACTSSKLNVIDADITKQESICPYFKNIDWVFHLAGKADIVPSIESPVKYHHANVEGTISVLESARTHKVKRFIYTASSSCYGISKQIPTTENAPLIPEYPYALTKYIGEQYAMHWSRVYYMPVISLRLFNVYGPRSRSTAGNYGAVFGVFLAQKIAGKPFTIVGDGSQTRDFTFVSDVVDGFMKSIQSSITSEIFNIGSGNTYSINYLVKLLGGKSVHIPKRPGEPDSTFANISKIKKSLKWKPIVPFEHGVNIMIDNIDQWKDAPIWDESSIQKATQNWFNQLSKNTNDKGNK
tara:strand:+ start:1620 stop:2633 length:1014 start_codon:yes stop_codon:yes gene_type:complete